MWCWTGHLREERRAALLSPRVYRMRRFLLPVCALVTPNLAEAGELTGREVTDIASAKDAAKAMHDNGAGERAHQGRSSRRRAG